MTLISTTRTWTGSSTETKPTPSAASPVPANSKFIETDTGRTFTFDGTTWVLLDKPEAIAAADRQDEILAEIRNTNELLGLLLSKF